MINIQKELIKYTKDRLSLREYLRGDRYDKFHLSYVHDGEMKIAHCGTRFKWTQEELNKRGFTDYLCEGFENLENKCRSCLEIELIKIKDDLDFVLDEDMDSLTRDVTITFMGSNSRLARLYIEQFGLDQFDIFINDLLDDFMKNEKTMTGGEILTTLNEMPVIIPDSLWINDDLSDNEKVILAQLASEATVKALSLEETVDKISQKREDSLSPFEIYQIIKKSEENKIIKIKKHKDAFDLEWLISKI